MIEPTERSSELQALARALQDIGAEYRPDEDGEGEYVQINTGFGEALQVEPVPDDPYLRKVLPYGDYVRVYARRWAPDHGLASEILLTIATIGFAPSAIRAAHADLEESERRLVAAMEEPEHNERLRNLWRLVADAHRPGRLTPIQKAVRAYLVHAWTVMTGDTEDTVIKRLTKEREAQQ